MIRRAEAPVVLSLEPGVLAISGALFVPVNSARSDVDLSDPALTTVDAFDAIFESPVGDRLKDWQAEVWIPEFISPLAIQGIATRDEATHKTLAANWERRFGAWPYAVDVMQTEEWNLISSIALDDL